MFEYYWAIQTLFELLFEPCGVGSSCTQLYNGSWCHYVLGDLAALRGEDAGQLRGQFLDLLRAQILARKIDVFVQWHALPSLFRPRLGSPRLGSP